MKPFDLKEIIQQRVNTEALVKWAETETPLLPSYQKPVIIKGRAGCVNFIKDILIQLKP